jgi:hypothetical protein
MNMMIPITIKPVATTAAMRVIVFGEGSAHHSAAGGDDHEQNWPGAVHAAAGPTGVSR